MRIREHQMALTTSGCVLFSLAAPATDRSGHCSISSNGPEAATAWSRCASALGWALPRCSRPPLEPDASKIRGHRLRRMLQEGL